MIHHHHAVLECTCEVLGLQRIAYSSQVWTSNFALFTALHPYDRAYNFSQPHINCNITHIVGLIEDAA